MTGPFTASKINRVIVVGAGVMGEGIAQSFAEAAVEVCLVDLNPEALRRCVSQIERNLELSEAYDVIDTAAAEVAARIRTTAADRLSEELETCDMAIETVPEILEAKRSVFATFDGAPDRVLLASNTSSFTISQLTEGMRTPERVVGLHYFNPAHIIPAVEIHKSAKTSQEAIAAADAIMKRTGKVPVLVRKEIPGFIINRLTGALSREIDHLLDEGVVDPEDLDPAIKASLGFRLAQIGPLEAKDFIGLDTDTRVSRNVYPQLSDRLEPSQLAQRRVAEGHLGVKSGKGIFDYSGRTRERALHERNLKLLEQRKLYLAAQSKEKTHEIDDL
ncbi:MAG: 3-hydroxyacyl-CoA dehydrogenase family protein [Henriciella sp.]